MKRVLRAVSALLLVLSGLSLVSCASDAGGSTATTGRQSTGSAGQSDLPDVTVSDIGSGESVSLSSLFPDPKPLLVWFWAPH